VPVRASLTFSFVLGAWAQNCRLRADPYDPQRPSGVECEGPPTAPLHSRTVRGDELKPPIIYHPRRLSPRLQTCNTAFKTESIQIDLISTCTGLSENVDELRSDCSSYSIRLSGGSHRPLTRGPSGVRSRKITSLAGSIRRGSMTAATPNRMRAR
jgi:hypothetical protein